MVAQNHRKLVVQIRLQTRLLIEIKRDAFVVVIRQAIVKAHRVLADVEQAAGLRRHRDAGTGVGVNHTLHILPYPVYGAVDHIACFIDAKTGFVFEDIAVKVHLHQGGGGDFIKHQAVGVDQKMMLRPRHARRNVGVDQVGHAVVRHQPVAGGEIDAHLPFGIGHAAPHRTTRRSFGFHHFFQLCAHAGFSV